jgi:transcriptional regulator with XRE-family HTH domain
MKLRDYLASKSITAAEFGRRIKVSQAAITRYATGDRIPEPAIMRRIASATRGAVVPNDFYTAKRGSPRPAKPNRAAMEAWNEWIEKNGIPFAGLRRW